jgi:hypothetical protein
MEHLEKSQEMPHYLFFPRQKIIPCTFRIRGTLVFLCPKEKERGRERERRRKKEREKESKREREKEKDTCRHISANPTNTHTCPHPHAHTHTHMCGRLYFYSKPPGPKGKPVKY